MARTWYSPVIGAVRWSCYIACHAVATGIFLLASWALARLVTELGEPKLYDTVPYRYIIDTVDIVLIIEFVVYGAFEDYRVFKEQEDDWARSSDIAYFGRVFSVYAVSVALVAVLSVGAVTAYCRPKLLATMAATFLVGLGTGRINIERMSTAVGSRFFDKGQNSPQA